MRQGINITTYQHSLHEERKKIHFEPHYIEALGLLHKILQLKWILVAMFLKNVRIPSVDLKDACFTVPMDTSL